MKAEVTHLIAAIVALSAPRGTLTSQTGAAPSPVRFDDVALRAGLDFLHINGASQERYLPEIMGSGGLFFDFDNDGWLDVFLVDGGSFADAGLRSRARHRLYRNRGKGTFEDVTARSGLGHLQYGMGT